LHSRAGEIGILVAQVGYYSRPNAVSINLSPCGKLTIEFAPAVNAARDLWPGTACPLSAQMPAVRLAGHRYSAPRDGALPRCKLIRRTL
jgi:hypothetical protein